MISYVRLLLRNWLKRAPRKASKSVQLVQSSQERCCFVVGEIFGSKGYRHTNKQTHKQSMPKVYLGSFAGNTHTSTNGHTNRLLFLSLVVLYVCTTMHTHNMYMTIILLGMHVCFVYGEDQRCPHPCMRIVPFL